MVGYREWTVTPLAVRDVRRTQGREDEGSSMSVIDFNNLSACANKQRQSGYWHYGIEFINRQPVPVTTWIPDMMSKECRYDRKQVDTACDKANCGKRYD